MNSQFKDLFNTQELKEIYSSFPPKLLHKDFQTIKKILKQTVEVKIGREKYKDILSKSSRIKSNCSRKKTGELFFYKFLCILNARVK